MTHKQITEVVGLVVELTLRDGVSVSMTVEDYKRSHGCHRWLLEPVAGTGEAWWQTDRMHGDAATRLRELERS
jgi:hypothetical protein